MRKPLHPLWTVGLLALLIALTVGRSSVRVHDYYFDGKMFYIGAKVLAQGGNPYDIKALQAASVQYAPEGWPAAAKNVPQMHLPGTLALFVPLSWLPWTGFCWLLAFINSVSIPLIAYLSLKNLSRTHGQPAHWAIVAASVAMLVFPATWQTFILGQLGLFLLLITLLLVRSIQRQNHFTTALFCLAAFLKFTNTLPLLLFLFMTGKRRTRMALLGGVGIYLVLNAVSVLVIGASTFFASYRQSMQTSFKAGEINSVSQGRRIDLENLMNLGLSPVAIMALKGLLLLSLVWFFWSRWKERDSDTITSVQFALLNCATLLAFYHSVYDAVLLLPVIFVIAALWKSKGTWQLGTSLAALFMGCTFCIGYSKVWNKVVPMLAITPPLAVSTVFVVGIFAVLVWLSGSKIENRELVRS